ncbi:MAG TPA: 4-hydroxy-tetrahydrodipicolinate reductase [Virgibacillus sp.]|nr:4-hydroxy-tetrahydrodipicolinate reductase [Virgibacillus sp.]
MSINIIIAGPRGKMGSEAIQMIQNDPKLNLVACIDRKNNGKMLYEIDQLTNLDVPIFEDPKQCFKTIPADVFLDLTIPDVGFEHTKIALQCEVRTVIGTSGFTDEQIDVLTTIAEANKVGCIIAPNFAIGAILMMQFAKQAAQFFPDIEIIEKHHDQKLDAPSGTAMKTIDMIRETRKPKTQGHPHEQETLSGSRGGDVDGIKVHSLRLPGLVAHQEVIFGRSGQTLTIKHDSLNRESFMDGINLAINHVMKLDKLVYGMENIINPIQNDTHRNE